MVLVDYSKSVVVEDAKEVMEKGKEHQKSVEAGISKEEQEDKSMKQKINSMAD